MPNESIESAGSRRGLPVRSDPVIPSSRLTRAVDALRDLGILAPEPNPAPIAALIRRVARLDETKAVIVARTLVQQQVFDKVVGDQVADMRVGRRFEEINRGFDSIRDDARRMLERISDGRLGIGERISNILMKVTRGDISDRFDGIRRAYEEVVGDVQEQIEREEAILGAYGDFRGALKEAEVLAYGILEKAEAEVAGARADVEAATKAIAEAQDVADARRAEMELARDDAVQLLQARDETFQIAKDLAENLRVGYGTTEVTMARLAQAQAAKRRLHSQAVAFFATNTSVLSALRASFTGIAGLDEATRSVDAMKDGLSRSLETLAEVGGKVQEAAVRAGHGPTIRAESVRKLVDSVVGFQARSIEIIDEMRVLSTRNADEIRESVEGGKRRMAELATRAES